MAQDIQMSFLPHYVERVVFVYSEHLFVGTVSHKVVRSGLYVVEGPPLKTSDRHFHLRVSIKFRDFLQRVERWP